LISSGELLTTEIVDSILETDNNISVLLHASLVHLDMITPAEI
jgi:hypothetical protein